MSTDKHGRRGGPPPAPEPLPVPVADAHTHLYLQDTGPAEAIEAARAVGVDRIVEVGCDVASARSAAALAATQPRVLAAVALHPNDAAELAGLGGAGPDGGPPVRSGDGTSGRHALREALAVVDELAGQPRVRAVGETGLDHFRTGPQGHAVQEESFRAHIRIAKRHGKPLMIHDRDAHADIFRVLESEGAPEVVVFHCFSGDAEMARRCAGHGWYASFAGNVTFRNARSLREAAAVLPAELMLVETDAPFLTPMPHRGRPNAPYLVPLTVRALAEVRAQPVDELCAALSTNADRVFGAW